MRSTFTSANDKCAVASYEDVLVVNSPERKNPKKPVQHAAQNKESR